MIQHATILDAVAATQTVELAATELGQSRFARSIQLEINGGSTPDWTLAIQGKVAAGATWHAIDYFRVDQGGRAAVSKATLTVNWTTAQHYVIPNPPPFVRLVATRTGGTLTVHGAFSSEGFSLAEPATVETSRALISGATSGDNTLVAADNAGRKIRVYSLFIVVAGAVTVRFESGASGTALTGVMSFAANGGISLPHNPDGWFETAADTLLNMELGGAVQASGALTYGLV